MILVDGYKAFRDAMRITPINGNSPYEIFGDWLYKPKHDCWYVRPNSGMSMSFPADICEVVEERFDKA